MEIQTNLDIHRYNTTPLEVYKIVQHNPGQLYCLIIECFHPFKIMIIIITDTYKAPILSRTHSTLQIYTTSTIHNTQTPIASNHM